MRGVSTSIPRGLDTSASRLPAADVYHGHEEVVRFFVTGLRRGRNYEVATREYIDAGMRWSSCPPERDGPG